MQHEINRLVSHNADLCTKNKSLEGCSLSLFFVRRIWHVVEWQIKHKRHDGSLYMTSRAAVTARKDCDWGKRVSNVMTPVGLMRIFVVAILAA